MKSKKNPNADIGRNSSLYFMVGLTVVLFTVWQLLEYKTYETENDFVQVLEVADNIDEDVPVTEQIRTAPPPPPPSAPAIIEVVEDELEIEETVIESTESSQDTEIAEAIAVDDVSVGEEEEDISVPFAVIENAPVFPGCEDLGSETERKACFNKKMLEHIRNNFKYPKTALELGITGRVFVKFDIDSKGRVSNILKRGPDRLLEDEAARIIALLPQMKPGQQRGRATKVTYSIPINFVVQ